MKVVWSESAVKVFQETGAYLEQQFSFQAAQNFHRRVFDVIYKVQKNPMAGRGSKIYPDIRFRNVGKRRLYYKIDEAKDRIVIIDIFDMRQDPDKLKY